MRAIGLVAAACLALAASAAPAVAAPPWSPPEQAPGDLRSDFGGFVGPHSVSFTPAGVGLVSYSGSPPKRASIRDGVVNAAMPLGVPFVPFSAEAYGKDSFAVAGLRDPGSSRADGVRVAVGRIDGPIAWRQTIGARLGALHGDMDANGRGDIALALYDRRGALRLAYRPAGRRFRRPIVVARPRGPRFAGEAVAINERGDVLMAWNARVRVRRGRTSDYAVFARIVRADGTAGRVQRLGTAQHRAIIHAALTPARRALVGWGPDYGSGRLVVAYASKGGRFHRAQVLDRFSSGGPAPPVVHVAFTAHGEGVAAWDHEGAGSVVRVAELGRTRFEPAQTLAADPAGGHDVELVTGSRGEALVTWTSGNFAYGAITASVRPPGGPFGAPEAVDTAPAHLPHAGIDPVSGTPFVFFSRQDGSRAYARREPVVP